MRRTIYICDRCGKEITDAIRTLSVDKTVIADGSIAPEHDYDEVAGRDFCAECTEEIMAFATLLPQKKNGGKKVGKMINGGSYAAPKIDNGKIFALKNAGWSYDQIREEFYKFDLTDAEIEARYHSFLEERKKQEEERTLREKDLDDLVCPMDL